MRVIEVISATSYKLQATSYKLQATSYKLQATSYKLQAKQIRAASEICLPLEANRLQLL
jgi:hypothetical protein